MTSATNGNGRRKSPGGRRGLMAKMAGTIALMERQRDEQQARKTDESAVLWFTLDAGVDVLKECRRLLSAPEAGEQDLFGEMAGDAAEALRAMGRGCEDPVPEGLVGEKPAEAGYGEGGGGDAAMNDRASIGAGAPRAGDGAGSVGVEGGGGMIVYLTPEDDPNQNAAIRNASSCSIHVRLDGDSRCRIHEHDGVNWKLQDAGAGALFDNGPIDFPSVRDYSQKEVEG